VFSGTLEGSVMIKLKSQNRPWPKEMGASSGQLAWLLPQEAIRKSVRRFHLELTGVGRQTINDAVFKGCGEECEAAPPGGDLLKHSPKKARATYRPTEGRTNERTNER